jgi:transposase
MLFLGAYCPENHEYLDLRLTRDNINGEQFVNLLRLLRAAHPEVEQFLLYVDGARYYSKPVVKEWLRRHPEFRLVPIPAYSPNLNLIERLWTFLRKEPRKNKLVKLALPICAGFGSSAAWTQLLSRGLGESSKPLLWLWTSVCGADGQLRKRWSWPGAASAAYPRQRAFRGLPSWPACAN